MKTKQIKQYEIIYKNVSLTYPNGFQALKKVNLQIEKGEFISLIGSSGAGKTTLMKTINKVNPITSGKLFVAEKEVNKLTGSALRTFRKEIGLIYQRYNLISTATVISNVLVSITPTLPWYRKIVTIYNKREKLHALSVLDKVGLLEKSYVRVANLSGGQMQRVALARTLAQSPSIILADEPVAALDPIMAKEIMDTFFKVNREDKYTTITNLHHVDIAIKYSDRIIGVKKGQVVYDGPATKITAKILKEIYGEKAPITDNEIKRAIEENKGLRNGKK